MQCWNEKNDYGETALMIASRKGHLDIVQELVKVEGINVNEKDMGGWTALIYASNEGDLDIVQELVKVEGINVNETNNDGDTARDIAIKWRDRLHPAHAEGISRFNQIIALLT